LRSYYALCWLLPPGQKRFLASQSRIRDR